MTKTASLLVALTVGLRIYAADGYLDGDGYVDMEKAHAFAWGHDECWCKSPDRSSCQSDDSWVERRQFAESTAGFAKSIFVGANGASGNGTLHVSTEGDDRNDGLSWETAKRTIQVAVDEAGEGDTILVGDGCYDAFAVDWQKPVTIRSVNGASKTCIDGAGSGRVFLSIDYRSALVGFTVTNGYDVASGGGVSGGILSNCVLRANTAEYSGGGAYESILYNCLLVDNRALRTYGGGASHCTLVNCTVVGNSASRGGGLWDSTARNCIVWGNFAADGENLYESTCSYTCTSPLLAGTGNISVDPAFVRASSGDYRLGESSACIDAGCEGEASGATDLDGKPRVVGQAVDMGAFEWQGEWSWTDPVSGIAWTYSTDASGDVTLLGASQCDRTLIVPEKVGGRPVVAIGDRAFAGGRAETVIIPGNIESVGANAFSNCESLAQVDFEGEPPIGLGAAGFPATTLVRYNDACEETWGKTLADARLTNVSSYHPLMDLDWDWEYCKDGSVRIVGIEDLRYHDHESGEVRIPSSLYGSPVTEVGGGWCGFGEYDHDFITAVTIPDGVHTIGDMAFDSCGLLTTARIPDSVTRIGMQAFCWCANLTNITLPKRLRTIDTHAFSSCNSLSEITIPASVTNIGNGAFANCMKLESFEVESGNPSYVSIDGVLYDKDVRTLIQCPALVSSIEIPKTVKAIETSAFFWCYRITSLHIPASVEEIGRFVGCDSLAKLTVDAKNKCFSVRDGVLYDHGKKTLVCCLPTCKAVDIPQTVVRVGDGAFLGCTNLAEIALPANLREIGEGAFEECWSLASITIPSGVRDVPDLAFDNCKSLKDVQLLGAVTNIGTDAFRNCRSLESLTLPASVKRIGSAAFTQCTSLELAFRGAPPQVEEHSSVWRTVGDCKCGCYATCRMQWASEIDAEGKWHGLRMYCVDPSESGVVYVDVEAGEVAPYMTEASVYDGCLYDGEKVVGSVQVKIAKGKTDRKTGVFSSKVTATVQLAGEAKKLNFKGGVADETGFVTEMSDKNGHRLAVMVGVKGIGGSFDGKYLVDGARNVFMGKSTADKSDAADAAERYQGAYNVAFGDGTLSVAVDKKGKAKIAGTVGGNKVSATGQLVVGETEATVPVVIAKKANLAFCLWLGADGTVELRGLEDAIVGKAGALNAAARFGIDLAAPALADVPGLLTEFLPTNVEVVQNGTKWVVAGGAKAGKLTLEKGTSKIDWEKSRRTDNMSGLKLSYKAKDGSFTGSFKVYGVASGKLKSYMAKVTGVMVGTKGYGTATIKKVGTTAVAVK